MFGEIGKDDPHNQPGGSAAKGHCPGVWASPLVWGQLGSISTPRVGALRKQPL